MNSEDVRARAEAVLAAWNRRDYDAVADNVSPHVVLVDHIRGRKTDGADQLAARFKQMLDAYEDMQAETVSVIVEGNQFAHETVWRGQHTAPLKLSTGETVDPTGEQVTVHLAIHAEVDDDGRPTMIRIYGTPTEIPAVAHATGSG